MSRDKRLTAEDWVEAALGGLLREGPDAVAVQPLARSLGATKGSFYWHFESRDALLRATLERWLQVGTLDVITAVEAAADNPQDRTRALFSRVTSSHAEHPGQLRLLASSNHPDIRRAVEQATRTRISFVADLLKDCGQPAQAARRRATLAYSMYLGHAQLAQSVPDVLPTTVTGRRALLDELTRIMFAP